jgi:hypothetical protein
MSRYGAVPNLLSGTADFRSDLTSVKTTQREVAHGADAVFVAAPAPCLGGCACRFGFGAHSRSD